MKSGIRLLCLLLCMVMFVSCGKQPKENTEPDKEAAESTSSGDSANNSLAYTTRADDVWEVLEQANRIFTGKLVSFDEDLSKNNQDQIYCAKKGKANLTIEVDGVYRGEYLVGTTVQEVYDYGVFSDINNPDFWEVGERYLFILGDITTGNLTKSVPKNSKHSVLKLDGSGKYELIDGSVDRMSGVYQPEPNSIYELFNALYGIEGLVESYFHKIYSQYEGVTFNNGYVWDPGENFEYTLEEMYELAEDVYFGEIISFVDHFYDEILVQSQRESPQLYKLKVRVMTVYKGDLKPGDIIEEITFYFDGYERKDEDGFASRSTNKTFFLTGGALDCGYDLDSDFWANGRPYILYSKE